MGPYRTILGTEVNFIIMNLNIYDMEITKKEDSVPRVTLYGTFESNMIFIIMNLNIYDMEITKRRFASDPLTILTAILS